MKARVGNKGIAELPGDWRWAQLGEICFEDRAIIDPVSEEARTLPYLGLEDVESNTGRITRRAEGSANTGISTSFRFSPGQVLYGKLRPYLNKVALPDFVGRCTTELIPLRPAPEIIPQYLAWLLRRPETIHAAMQEKTGSRMPRADMDSLLRMRVPVPPSNEQERIATGLNEQFAAVARARAAAQARLEAAEDVLCARVRCMFTTTGFQSHPRRLLREFAETCSGTTPSRNRPDYYEGTIPWVKTSELKDDPIADTEEHVTDLALRSCSLPALPSGTVLIAMYGQGQTRGRTALLSCVATTNQACFAVLPKPEVFDSRYLQIWFRHSYERLRRESEGRGGNQPNLNGVLLRSQEVPLPPLAVQKEIAESTLRASEHVTKLITALKAELAGIEALPAAILREAFEGNL
jgi:type I restriction enzyme S subunit